MIGEDEIKRSLREFYDAHELEKLIAYCSELIALSSPSYLYYGARGKAFLDLEQYEEAVSDLCTALTLNPDYVLGLYNRGICYLDTFRFESAILDFELACTLDNRLCCYDLIGLAYLSLKNNEKAIENFNQQLDIQLDKQVLALRAEAHRNLQQYKKALLDYEIILLEESKQQDILEHVESVNNFAVSFSPKASVVPVKLDFEKKGFVLCPHSRFDVFFPNISGVYILKFANCEFYVGQTKTLVSRLRSHHKTYEDISEIYFKPVAEGELLSEEEEAISLLELNQYRIRNLKQIKFSNLFNQSDQEKWGKDIVYNYLAGEKFKNESIREKYKERFILLKSKPYFPTFASFTSEYIRRAIPNYIASEYNYWSISCLPKYLEEDGCISRININSIPVLSVYTNTDNSLYMMLVVSKLPFLVYLKENFGFHSLFDDIPSLGFEFRNVFENSDGDEITLFVEEADFLKVLSNEIVLSAIRTFNLRMMNNTGKEIKYRRTVNHCLDLSDYLLNNSGM